MRERIFTVLAAVCYRHPRLVTLVILSSGLAAAVAVMNLDLQTQIEDLLPDDSVVVRNYFDVIDAFGLSEYLIMFIQTDEAINLDIVAPFADALRDRLSALPTIAQVDHRFRFDEMEKFEALMLESLPLFLDEPQLDELLQRLTPEGMGLQLKKARRLLISGASMEMQQYIADDPLALLTDFTSTFVAQSGQFNLAVQDGYYLSQDGTKLFILLKAAEPPQNIQFDMVLDAEVRGAIDSVRTQFADDANLNALRIKYTGPHIIVINESRLINRDILATAISSLLGVLLLFMVAFRRPATIIYVGVPLVIGILWTLAIGYLCIGYLNLLTSVCSAITTGLGIDFAIHIYSRYLDERAHGREPHPALRISLVHTGKAILTGALTTALAFYAMMFTDFRGIAEFGFMTGTGILCCLVSMTTLLPALIAWREQLSWRPYHYTQMSHFGFHRLPGFIRRRHRWILVVCGGFTVLSLLLIPRVRFNDDLQSIRSTNNPAMEIQQEIQAVLGSSLKPTTLIFRDMQDADPAVVNEEAIRRLEESAATGSIAWIDSLQRYLPPPGNQRKALEWLADNRDRIDPNLLKPQLQAALSAAGLRYLPAYDTYIERIAHSLRNNDTINLAGLKEGLLDLVLKRYLVHEDDGWQLAMYLYPRHKLTDTSVARTFLDGCMNALAGMPDHYLTGMSLLTLELKERIHRSFRTMTILVAAGVFFTLLVSFRRLGPTLISIIPVSLGILWMVASMNILGMEFNYINIAVTPMIIGIGIDDGIHILYRYLASSRNLDSTLHSTGKAIMMTSLTTIVGFGSLTFAGYRGISSMGVLSTLGIGFCLLASILFLPALLVLLEQFRNGADGADR